MKEKKGKHGEQGEFCEILMTDLYMGTRIRGHSHVVGILESVDR